MDIMDDENLGGVLRSLYKPETLSVEYRGRLLREIKATINADGMDRPKLRLIDFFAIAIALFTVAVIAYGILLPQQMFTSLLQ